MKSVKKKCYFSFFFHFCNKFVTGYNILLLLYSCLGNLKCGQKYLGTELHKTGSIDTHIINAIMSLGKVFWSGDRYIFPGNIVWPVNQTSRIKEITQIFKTVSPFPWCLVWNSWKFNILNFFIYFYVNKYFTLYSLWF